jgi:hypothetical protein
MEEDDVTVRLHGHHTDAACRGRRARESKEEEGVDSHIIHFIVFSLQLLFWGNDLQFRN